MAIATRTERRSPPDTALTCPAVVIDRVESTPYAGRPTTSS